MADVSVGTGSGVAVAGGTVGVGMGMAVDVGAIVGVGTSVELAVGRVEPKVAVGAVAIGVDVAAGFATVAVGTGSWATGPTPHAVKRARASSDAKLMLRRIARPPFGIQIRIASQKPSSVRRFRKIRTERRLSARVERGVLDVGFGNQRVRPFKPQFWPADPFP